MNATIAELKKKRRYASVLMTYSCTVACEHCCFNCSPDKPEAVVSVDNAVRYLEEFHKIDRLIHIAGGEPFRYPERVLDIVRAAYRHGVPPHFVETNCSWCVSDEIARDRMQELKANGVLWMLISTDWYHMRQLDPERVARGLAIAEEIFGKGTTMGLCTREELMRKAEIARDEDTLASCILANPPRLVGRAAEMYADYLPPRPIEGLRLETSWGIDPANTCNKEWDPLWEIHVDPYGNLQTNCGIILGNAERVPVSELMRSWHYRNPILRRFSERGVASLLEAAREYGFEPEDSYPQNCLLCLKLRTFLRERDGDYRAVFGPDEVYGDT